MRFSEFKGLLIDWASKVLEAVQAGFPEATVFHRFIELGPVGASIRSGRRLESNYWPNSKLVMLTNAIYSLPIEDRNIIILKRVYGHTYREIGNKVKLTHQSAERRLIKIEDNLYDTLK